MLPLVAQKIEPPEDDRATYVERASHPRSGFRARRTSCQGAVSFACDLIFQGRSQANGDTELILHRPRREASLRQLSYLAAAGRRDFLCNFRTARANSGWLERLPFRISLDVRRTLVSRPNVMQIRISLAFSTQHIHYLTRAI